MTATAVVSAGNRAIRIAFPPRVAPGPLCVTHCGRTEPRSQLSSGQRSWRRSLRRAFSPRPSLAATERLSAAGVLVDRIVPITPFSVVDIEVGGNRRGGDGGYAGWG